ncbi:pyridoxal phosphate-dependent aminotransferase [Candidatus Micrarchaeota archaeon]|nr:pyridoxal phosphate-dependent aminotransferase [Candidatus Micrarchaeota archaeon]
MAGTILCEQEVFKSDRYRGPRGKHLSDMRRREFGKTPVDDRINDIQRNSVNPVRVLDMCFGDPSRYPDMGPYDGVHRFLRRYLNFHDNPRACASYDIWGDPEYIGQMRRGSANIEAGDLEVPKHVAVYPTAGVAGALRMILPAILLPPGEDGVRDNVLVPKWTYLSHSAEAAFALGDVRTCGVRVDGQIDLENMFTILDKNTQAVILATVGNPLGSAMSPALFDEMVMRIYEKQQEFGHPIIVVADSIYEHFRRKREERIDAIQRVLHLGTEVPIIETSSFSKLFAMPGYRLGFYRALWKEGGNFAKEREDFFTALNTVYGTTLCPVPNIIQKAVGSLYAAIQSRLPVEEELAPVAAVLVSLKDLRMNRGGGDTHTLMPEEVPEDIIRRLGVDPEVWFTTSAIAKRTRKLANPELGKYNVDIDTSKVEEIGEILLKAGFIEKKELEVTRSKMIDILTAAVLKHGDVEHKLLVGLERGLSEAKMMLTDIEKQTVIQSQLEQLLDSSLRKPDVIRGEVSDLQGEFGIIGPSVDNTDTVKLTFFRLKDSARVPNVPRTDEDKLILEGISQKDYSWVQFAKACGLPTEDDLYEEQKRTKRSNFEIRTDYFIRGLDQMGREGLGVYLHPFVYDEDGNLHPERVNSFYVMFGFHKLKGGSCQSADLVSKCDELGKALLKFTPGEVFLPLNDRGPDDSYIRAVTLDSIEKIDEVLGVIRSIATYLAAGEVIPYQPGGAGGKAG